MASNNEVDGLPLATPDQPKTSPVFPAYELSDEDSLESDMEDQSEEYDESKCGCHSCSCSESEMEDESEEDDKSEGGDSNSSCPHLHLESYFDTVMVPSPPNHLQSQHPLLTP